MLMMNLDNMRDNMPARQGEPAGSKIGLAALLALSFCAAAWSQGALAEGTLADPTRPAPEWLRAQPSAPGAKAATVESGPVLQLLRVDRTRQYAIIDGQMVKAGDTVKNAKVVAVRRDEVLLQDGETRQSLQLNPDIKKTVIVQESSPRSKKAGGGKKRAGKPIPKSKATEKRESK